MENMLPLTYIILITMIIISIVTSNKNYIHTLCIYLYVYVYVYMCIYICTCIRICICMCIYIYITGSITIHELGRGMLQPPCCSQYKLGKLTCQPIEVGWGVNHRKVGIVDKSNCDDPRKECSSTKMRMISNRSKHQSLGLTQK